jgi:ribosomal protein L11 methyltransferase
VPYRVDLHDPGDAAFDRLIDLGALDIEYSQDARIAALMPDSVSPEQITTALGVDAIAVSPATARDDGSVWVLNPRPLRVGHLRIAPADTMPEPGTLRLIDAEPFGTGLHPTTALCLEALDEAVQLNRPDAVLDVGTGSGVLALGALTIGVPRALGIDIDDEALRVAAENARINALDRRLELRRGGPDTLSGTWPLVLANVLAAPLIEMAPALVRLVGRQGQLVLSGVPSSAEHEVAQAFMRLGMRRLHVRSRGGWVVLVLQPSW